MNPNFLNLFMKKLTRDSSPITMDAISSVFCAIHPNIGAWLLLFAAVIFSLIMAGILLNRRLTAANIG
jgi:hypothetical protein